MVSEQYILKVLPWISDSKAFNEHIQGNYKNMKQKYQSLIIRWYIWRIPTPVIPAITKDDCWFFWRSSGHRLHVGHCLLALRVDPSASGTCSLACQHTLQPLALALGLSGADASVLVADVSVSWYRLVRDIAVASRPSAGLSRSLAHRSISCTVQYSTLWADAVSKSCKCLCPLLNWIKLVQFHKESCPSPASSCKH